MTKKIFKSYSTFLCLAVVMAGVTTAHASEVTGNLSSDTSASTPTTGSIGGNVSSESSGSGGGGSRSGGSRGGNSSNSPSASVLGISDSNTPGFPNAGSQPEVGSADQTLWSQLTAFFRNIFSF